MLAAVIAVFGRKVAVTVWMYASTSAWKAVAVALAAAVAFCSARAV
jgi:hypothetical protein